MTHSLEADGIQLEFGHKKILSDIYIKCETGEIVGILGRNGAGKSCLMNTIYGSLRNIDKSIRFDGNAIMYPFKKSNLIVYLPQFDFIPSFLTLKRTFQDFNIDFSDFENDFPDYKLTYKNSFGNLSSGQRRLVEIYLIIKSSAQFVMLDEPFTHIMPNHIDIIQDIILREKKNKGFLITDHLYQFIVRIADRLYILKDGKTYLSKSAGDLQALGYAKL